jgi:hypothetical protein
MTRSGWPPAGKVAVVAPLLLAALAGIVWDDLALRDERLALQAANAALRQALAAGRATGPVPAGVAAASPSPSRAASTPRIADPLTGAVRPAGAASGPSLEAALERLRPSPRAMASPFGTP